MPSECRPKSTRRRPRRRRIKGLLARCLQVIENSAPNSQSFGCIKSCVLIQGVVTTLQTEGRAQLIQPLPTRAVGAGSHLSLIAQRSTPSVALCSLAVPISKDLGRHSNPSCTSVRISCDRRVEWIQWNHAESLRPWCLSKVALGICTMRRIGASSRNSFLSNFPENALLSPSQTQCVRTM
jgi:hypothetical protein